MLQKCQPVIENILHKQIDPVTTKWVYMWQDPLKEPDYRLGPFLNNVSYEQFKSVYGQEQVYQR